MKKKKKYTRFSSISCYIMNFCIKRRYIRDTGSTEDIMTLRIMMFLRTVYLLTANVLLDVIRKRISGSLRVQVKVIGHPVRVVISSRYV